MPKDILISFDPESYISTIVIALNDENESNKINLDSLSVGNEIWKTVEYAIHIFFDTLGHWKHPSKNLNKSNTLQELIDCTIACLLSKTALITGIVGRTWVNIGQVSYIITWAFSKDSRKSSSE